MAQGRVRGDSAIVKSVVQFCITHDINIFQMPCPESLCPSGGLGRAPHGKAWYDKNGLRQTSQHIAVQQVDYMARLVQYGCRILAVIMVEFSPACAINYLNKGQRIVPGIGIYAEELKEEMFRNGMSIPLIGVNQRWKKRLARELSELLDTEDNASHLSLSD